APCAVGSAIILLNRGPDPVGVAKRIPRNTVGLVLLAAAQICGIEERGAVGADLGNEGVLGKVARASRARLQGMRRWEVGRGSPARDESRAVVGHRNGVGAIDAAAAKVGGVRQDRINNEREAQVVLAYPERYLVLALKHVATV